MQSNEHCQFEKKTNATIVVALDTGNTTAGENNVASLEKKPKRSEREEIRKEKERKGREKKKMTAQPPQ